MLIYVQACNLIKKLVAPILKNCNLMKILESTYESRKMVCSLHSPQVGEKSGRPIKKKKN